MISCEECVFLSDDDNSVQAPALLIKKKRKIEKHNNHKITNSIETIVIDEEQVENNSFIDNNNVVVLPDSENLSNNEAILNLDKIYQQDELFSTFIEKCLDLENSDGMIRIINRTVITTYEESDIEYRKSEEFRRVLLKAIKRLDTDPDHKFSHVKDVVETMKLHKPKKRVQLTTLATNLKGNGLKQKAILPRKRKINSIILDSDDEQKIIPTINLDDYPNEIIDLDDKKTDEEKENHVKENVNIQNSQENFLVPLTEVPWESNVNTQESVTSTFEPGVTVLPIEYDPTLTDTEQIIMIESQIQWCKKQIARLEETEVVDDNEMSPYVLCEKFKGEVVKLYKKLCQLTGEQAVKHRKVRLQALEGHPPGPVRRLETFINDNIGEDGTPLFPDFCDVVKCVMVANLEDNLGWKKQQVMREAEALFTHCGRALQKQRQRREYRDLLSRMKVEGPEFDPAHEDPELLRRLEENKKVAIKKEKDLLAKYVNLQDPPQQELRTSNLEEVVTDCAPESSSDLILDSQSQTVTEWNAAPCDQILDSQSQTVADCNSPSSPVTEIISDEDSNFEPPEIKLSQDTEKTDLGTDNNEMDVKVKKEPIDIVQLLEALGDNYTMSVIDIEDPYLAIEISSDDDSSDEEIHVEGESD